MEGVVRFWFRTGIEIRDVFDFTPHMTLMKMKTKHGHQFRSHYLDTARLLEILGRERDFGTQILDNVHLCEISEERRKDGFYISPANIEFHPSPE